MVICGNPSLTNCELQNLCDYLANPGGVVLIVYNGPGCNSAIELSVACGITSPCLPYGWYFFQSQADIDNFSLVYPGCTELEGLLSIRGFDVSNLEGISAVTSIGSNLHIIYCASLTDLTDLNNLVSVGGSILIQDNESLENLTGFEGITSVPGTLDFERNPNLLSLAGLENISSIGSLIINDSPLLGNLNGLSNLNTIVQDMSLTGNASIKDLSGLSNLTSINGTILIDFNNDLISLSGLDNIDANSISSMYIHHNDSLSDCAINSICDFLINTNGYSYIEFNAHGCANEEEVIAQCTVGSAQVPDIEYYKIYPNPATTFIIFKNDSPSTNYLYLTISDLKGRQLIRERVDAAVNVININWIPAGIYFVKIIGDQTVYVEKVVKQ